MHDMTGIPPTESAFQLTESRSFLGLANCQRCYCSCTAPILPYNGYHGLHFVAFVVSRSVVSECLQSGMESFGSSWDREMLHGRVLTMPHMSYGQYYS